MILEKIKKIFLDSGLKILSLNKLDEYILFCEENKTTTEKFTTNEHHILPKASSLPFEKYKDLKLNKWNCSTLTLENHLIAHRILKEAIEHYAVVTGLSILEKINKTETIETKKERAKLQSYYQNEIIDIDGITMSRAKHRGKNIAIAISDGDIIDKRSKSMKETVNYKEWKETVGIEKSTKQKNTINSKEWKETVGIEKVEKWKNSMSKKDALGKTVHEISASKQKLTKTSPEWDKKEIERVRKYRETMNNKQSYSLINIDSNIIPLTKTKKEIREMSPSLFNTTSEKYLGWSKTSRSRLQTNNNEHLLGYYIEVN